MLKFRIDGDKRCCLHQHNLFSDLMLDRLVQIKLEIFHDHEQKKENYLLLIISDTGT